MRRRPRRTSSSIARPGDGLPDGADARRVRLRCGVPHSAQPASPRAREAPQLKQVMRGRYARVAPPGHSQKGRSPIRGARHAADC